MTSRNHGANRSHGTAIDTVDRKISSEEPAVFARVWICILFFFFFSNGFRRFTRNTNKTARSRVVDETSRTTIWQTHTSYKISRVTGHDPWRRTVKIIRVISAVYQTTYAHRLCRPTTLLFSRGVFPKPPRRDAGEKTNRSQKQIRRSHLRIATLPNRERTPRIVSDVAGREEEMILRDCENRV